MTRGMVLVKNNTKCLNNVLNWTQVRTSRTLVTFIWSYYNNSNLVTIIKKTWTKSSRIVSLPRNVELLNKECKVKSRDPSTNRMIQVTDSIHSILTKDSSPNLNKKRIRKCLNKRYLPWNKIVSQEDHCKLMKILPQIKLITLILQLIMLNSLMWIHKVMKHPNHLSSWDMWSLK